jgi:hypothetical protein
MAVNVQCSEPQELLNGIRKAIRDGSIETWLVDSDGDFTHAPTQWKHKAWFRPRVTDDRLIFNILAPRGTDMTRTVYGVYHGRLIEMLLTHFDLKFARACATALATTGDLV